MSKVFIEEDTLIGIGNAIREKNGTTDLIATTDMASAISNLPSGGSATYPDLWYNANRGYTRNMYSQYDVANASKITFDYEIRNNTTTTTSYNTTWVITACKGYGVQADSNTYSPSCVLVEIDDEVEEEIVLTYKTTGKTSGSAEINIEAFTTLSLEIVSGTDGTSSGNTGFLHLSNIQIT